MTTELGKKLEKLSPECESNPVFARLLRVVHSAAGNPKRFNDGNTPHRDFVNNRNGAHTDVPGEHFHCPELDDENYSDITYGDGRHSGHGDITTPSDAHTHSSHDDYSDMTR
jgi:hypothetical protein